MSEKKLVRQDGAAAGAKPRAADSRVLLGALFLLAATFLVYLPAIRAGFIWDDPQYVLNNRTLRDLDGLQEMWLHPTSLPQWYPMVHTTFWVEYHLVGTHPLLYHVDNVLLHAISAILVWRLLSKLDVPGAFFAACVFAVHPVMVESVAWVAERKNTLSLVFYLLAMMAYLRTLSRYSGKGLGEGLHAEAEERPSSQPSPGVPGEGAGAAAAEGVRARAYLLALILFLAALFSKTVTASLPAATLLILWWRRGRLRLRDVLPLVPFFVVGIALGAYTGYLERTHVGASGEVTPELNFSFAQRCLIAGRAVWFYLGKLIVPHPLTFIYPRWNEIDAPSMWQWIFPAMVIVATLALFALRNRVGRAVLAGWLIFCGTLFPALGFVNVYPMRYSFVADHFQYHASIAVIAMLGAAAARLTPRVRGGVVGSVLVVLGLLTFSQSRDYKNAETLWRETARKNPASWMVWTNLGNALAAQGRYDEAAPCHEHALVLAPDILDTRWNYGVSLMRQNKIDDAETQFRKSIDILPAFAMGYESLGELYFNHRDDPKQAVEFFRKAVELQPAFANAHCKLGVALEREFNDAKKQIGDPRDPAKQSQAAQLLIDAIDHYRQAVAADPENLEAHYNLGNCLTQIRNFDEAIWNFQQALRIDPDYAEAWTNLGSAYFQTGRFRDAADAFAQALRIKPDLEPARRGLAAARSRG